LGILRNKIVIPFNRTLIDSKLFCFKRFLHLYSALHTLSHPNIVQLHGVTAGSVETAVAAGKECGYFIVIDRLYGTLESKIELWGKEQEAYHKHYESAVGGVLHRLFASSPSSAAGTATTPHLPTLAEYKQHKKEIFFERIRLSIHIASAMQYIHSLNLVYRDLKPDNIGFTNDGIVKLFDFGLTKELKPTLKVKDGSNNYRLTGNTVRYFSSFLIIWKRLKIYPKLSTHHPSCCYCLSSS
jgi:serine/threonine protein kinase